MAGKTGDDLPDNSDDADLSFSSNIFEYKWPLDDVEAPTYVLQEQIAEYLEIRGFSRKYPDLSRRAVEFEERDFLVELGIVTETQSNLGLVALQSSEVYQIMFEDYPQKFSQYMEILEQRYFLQLIASIKADKQKLAEQQAQRKATQSKEMCTNAASFNKKLRLNRKRSMYDYQNKIYQILQPLVDDQPCGPQSVSVDNMYPAALIPGQYTTFVPSFTASDLNCLPVKTVLRLPQKVATVEGASVYDEPPISMTIQPPPPPPLPLPASVARDAGVRDGSLAPAGPMSVADTPAAQRVQQVTRDPAFSRRSVLDKIQRSSALLCSICRKSRTSNSAGLPEDLLECTKCHLFSHPSCLGLESACIESIRTYAWQCNDCKLCWMCQRIDEEDQVILCDKCDRGYHSFCVGLEDIPAGEWLCDLCS